ncbi:crotonobetainyl-CoA:carnitine CoA-transferase CaiB-like acyl-CoA transferase [Chryseobacterium rhizosphaerae]|uniref:CoA transferase n=1 Tax=Chryseobacterium rhizosphaerae TaxID=395937 RepID=UPI00068F8617|nr:CoA transferase [Chryseobacterium rhizosphaerae]MDR6547343.1 crotonobetainyl-CoA:carnitine CoA-transferase CaiB-like acyl-CoA transferase [Chryseobacterium rhizosphaerae]
MKENSIKVDLEKIIQNNLDNRLTTDEFDLHAETEYILNTVGASLSDFGGKLSFYGKDPIIPSVLRYGAQSAVTLAAKAAQIADIWRLKTGETQDIHVDLRKALRRFASFFEGTLEQVNGKPGNVNSELGSGLAPNIFYKTKDDRWIQFTCLYPTLRHAAGKLLNCNPTQEKIAEAVKQWNAADLEEAGGKAGIPLYILRSPEEFMKLDMFQKVAKNLPVIKIEKVADSDPIPLPKGGDDALSGIKALGLGHVIAGCGIGRALALHGADVLNVWRYGDYEHELFHFTSNVGMRSTCLDFDKNEEDDKAFQELLSTADIFFSNRRSGFLNRKGLNLRELGKKHPGLITATVYFNSEEGPGSDRVGFDVSAGALAGPYWLESLGGTYKKTDVPHPTPQIAVINDYMAAWLAVVGILQALKLRATEGGSYKVSVSLSRTVAWQLGMGIFDQKFAYDKANSDDEHAYILPDFIEEQTPMGFYKGVTEQVEMTKTPGKYKHLLEPLKSSQPKWE